MKKNKFLLWVLLPMLLTSCELDYNGEAHLTGLGWFLLIVIIASLVLAIIKGNADSKVTQAKMKEKGIEYHQFLSLGTYGGGHPSIDKTIENVYCRKEDNILSLYVIPVMTISMPDHILNGEIPIDAIENVTIEDASSIEKKITVGRILLVGIFALGWKKKKKNELAFLVIEWKKGKFEHATTFSFEGKDAFQNANTARNKLISYCG